MRRRFWRPHDRAGIANDPEWYKDAIIYELRVRSFFDGDANGYGDFRGLTSKLDYLSDLGVSALWLLPFYPSPQRDDGYDISDYTDVDPKVGTLDDFRTFVEQAHARGLRVITELVLNHTSDQHPWFQRARQSPAGSADRNFYVWSPDPSPYGDARIIFKDFENSNWSRDPVAEQYYWHRFYAHQPDLNFENPAVHDALLAVVDFWLALGVDGFRLDAVPYLYEENGTNCENLPQTHAFLRKLRAHVEAKFGDRMLLAEANQWPEDAATYFGTGDECHMNFHFPIMPRLFMAIHMEDSFPIVDILAQTPTPPGSCQWALFLRNHDELTLEMVTDDERDYMYRAYARESVTRINLGIRRRLAPLVGNDRRKIELLNGLLCSLAGTPVLYYGDEIGMGDNVFLGDRNGVRTPMQWSMGRNAGFSTASTQSLVLPVNTDSEYHYECSNVEVQRANPASLLWWMKRLLAARRDYRAFGRGTLEIVTHSNPRVLAFVRRFEAETILVVANLSRSVQHVELDLGAYRDLQPVDLFGGSAFPSILDTLYPVALSGYAFYWFSLEQALGAEGRGEMPRADPITLVGATAKVALEDGRRHLEEHLPTYLDAQPWYRGRGQRLTSASVTDLIPSGASEDSLTWLFVRVEYEGREPETCLLLLAFVPDAVFRAGRFSRSLPVARGVVGKSIGEATDSVVAGAFVDVLDDGPYARLLFETIALASRSGGARAVVRGWTRGVALTSALQGTPHLLPGRHANAPFQCDDRYLLKVLRYVDDGTNVELEIAQALTKAGVAFAPRVRGALELVDGRDGSRTLAVLSDFIPNTGTAWQRAVGELGRYFEKVLTTERPVPLPPPTTNLPRPTATLTPALRELLGAFLDEMVDLGHRTADFHRTLLEMTAPEFAWEPYSTLGRRAEYQSFRNLAGTVLRELQGHVTDLPRSARADALFVLQHAGDLRKRFDPFLAENGPALRLRIHGNFHLEQVLCTGKDFVIVDFGGERRRSFNERRRKQSPLRDIAGLLRSIENASLVALWEPGTVREVDRAVLAPWANLWATSVSDAFVLGYERGAAGTHLIPERPAQAQAMLDAFGMESTLRDLREDLAWRPEEAMIPLRMLARDVEAAAGKRSQGAPHK